MKKVTVKTIEKMDFAGKVKLANKLIKAMEGDYTACLKLAWKDINDKNVKNINKTLKAVNAKDNKQEEKQDKEIKQENKKAPNKKEKESVNEKNDIVFKADNMPLINSSLVVEYSIDSLVIYELIEKRLSKGMKRNVVTEAFERIEQAKTLDELKKAVLLYFADVQIRKNAYKYITLGMNHKKLEKHLTEEEKRQYTRYDFNYISPNADMIRAEAEDVLQDVRVTIEKGFKNDNIFSSKINLYSALKLLVSNALRTEINRKFKSNVTIKNFNDFNINGKDGEEASDNEKMDIVVNSRVEETSNYNKALSMLEEIDFLTDHEKEIFKLKLKGYSEKEINDMKGKRLDRVYRKIDKKFMERLGITDHKQFRSMFKSTKRNLAK